MDGTSGRNVGRRTAMARLAALGVAAGALAASAARAAPLDPLDERAVGAVVREQMDALAADDAAKAFAFATPAIRAMFRDPQTFLAMVQRGYAALVRPRSAVHFKPESVEADEAELRVQLVDREGAAWLAVYRLERQADRSWRISACVLAPGRAKIV